MTLRLEQWSPEAEKQLLRAISAEMMPFVRAEVVNRVSQLWHGFDDFADCYIISRLEGSPLEWCFVACAGRGCMHYARELVAEGRRRKFSMRCHVTKESTARLWRMAGFAESEKVLRA